MVQALIWGMVAGGALLLGALSGLFLPIPRRITAFIMAFGTGVLIGAASFELLGKIEEKAGYSYVIIGFSLGAIVFTVLEMFISKKGGKDRKLSRQKQVSYSGMAIFIGSIMDSIPESVIIGVSFLKTNTVSWVIVIAIFISNFPEALSSSIGLKKDGYSIKKILFMWTIVFALTSLSSFFGFIVFRELNALYIYLVSGLAAGGIIAMVASTMMPESFEEGGPVVGLLTALGLLTSFILSSGII
ncbi:zinc transporter ZupT [Bacillus sp. THAF10]|uniref:ZIP family metal transporter n=1 Tax=Bacillus sp. THAF10 TaxID=2587848 RepID=UPI0012684424|nr:ZIP family metal transporter [Bacillus sp. THAF10]QFT89246.1 zinc transporter ZupT [Bacillus sp. THAF10]